MKNLIFLISVVFIILTTFISCTKEVIPEDNTLADMISNSRTIACQPNNSIFIETTHKLDSFYLLADLEADYCSCDGAAINNVAAWFIQYPGYFLPYFSIHPDSLDLQLSLESSLCEYGTSNEKLLKIFTQLDSLGTYSIISENNIDSFKLFLTDLVNNPGSISYCNHMANFSGNSDDSKLFRGLIYFTSGLIPAMYDSELPGTETVAAIIQHALGAVGGAFGSVLWEIGTTVYDHGEEGLRDPAMGKRYWRAALGGAIVGGITAI